MFNFHFRHQKLRIYTCHLMLGLAFGIWTTTLACQPTYCTISSPSSSIQLLTHEFLLDPALSDPLVHLQRPRSKVSLQLLPHLLSVSRLKQATAVITKLRLPQTTYQPFSLPASLLKSELIWTARPNSRELIQVLLLACLSHLLWSKKRVQTHPCQKIVKALPLQVQRVPNGLLLRKDEDLDVSVVTSSVGFMKVVAFKGTDFQLIVISFCCPQFLSFDG